MSHLPDTLVLNHPLFLKSLWPEPTSLIDLLCKFYNIVRTIEPGQNVLVDNPISVEFYHFHGKDSMLKSQYMLLILPYHLPSSTVLVPPTN